MYRCGSRIAPPSPAGAKEKLGNQPRPVDFRQKMGGHEFKTVRCSCRSPTPDEDPMPSLTGQGGAQEDSRGSPEAQARAIDRYGSCRILGAIFSRVPGVPKIVALVGTQLLAIFTIVTLGIGFCVWYLADSASLCIHGCWASLCDREYVTWRCECRPCVCGDRRRATGDRLALVHGPDDGRCGRLYTRLTAEDVSSQDAVEA